MRFRLRRSRDEDDAAKQTPEPPTREETEEETKARELVERIAREVDEEMNRTS